MSADNWGTCPKCSARIWRGVEAREAETAKLYGKMPADEWAERHAGDVRRRTELETAEDGVDEPFNTLREDYEVGVRGKKFVLRYSGNCTADGCGFEFDKNVEEELASP